MKKKEVKKLLTHQVTSPFLQRVRIIPITLFIAFLSLSSLVMAQAGTIRGSVTDEYGEPVVGANVIIWELKTGAATNPDGLFSIPKVPGGKHKLRVTYLGMDTLYQEVEMEEGKSVTVKLQMKESGGGVFGDEVQITDQVLGQIQKREITTGVTEITPRQITMMPSLGTPDLAQYLQVLPGVVTTGDQGGQLYIRGGTPIQNMVLLDGAIIYTPFHSIGMFSVFDTDYLRSVDVYSAAFPAQYGGRISSIMDIRTRNGNFKNFGIKAHLNPISAGLLAEGPLGKPKAGSGGNSYLLSLRESHLDQTSLALYNYVNDTVGLPFSFIDGYGKVTFSDGGNYLNLFAFSHNDAVNYGFPADYRWNSFGGGTNFQLLPLNSNMILTGNMAFSSIKSGLASVSEQFPRSSGINGFNGGLNFAYILNSVDDLAFGFTFLGFNTNYRFTNSFGLITEESADNTEAAFNMRYKKIIRKFLSKDHTQLDSIIDRVVLEPSLRMHYFNDHRHVSFEPRLRTKFNFNHISFTLAGGLFAQNLIAATSDRDVVNLFQGFLAAPPDLNDRIKNHSLQTAAHGLTGIEIELFKGMETTVEGWVKQFTQLTNINRDKIFPSDPDYVTETGIAYGTDLLVRYQNENWYVYGNYGLARVQRDNGDQIYPTVWDRRHNANLVVSYRGGKLINDEQKIAGKVKFDDSKWELSGRWALGSGFPFTQTQGFFEKIDFNSNGAQTDYTTQNGNLGILYADKINGGRLPYFHRLDLTAKRRWAIKNRFLLEANVSLYNTYNRKNVFYFDRIRFVVVNQLPILPSVGLTVTY
ncbi:MAG: carboxypeptidase-like regulatory domain-containing protein [Bacteroidia bacterium]|nr:carboxypeptidase-like regulatory domain-containing protein [Bacteroidia bacterium]